MNRNETMLTFRGERLVDTAIVGEDAIFTLEGYRKINGVYLLVPLFRVIRPLRDVREYRKPNAVLDPPAPRPVVTLQ